MSLGNGTPAKRPPAAIERVQLKYPLDYTFKIMGLAADDFAEHARHLVATAVERVVRVKVRASSRGKYQSVTVIAHLVSEAQREAVYQALWTDARVVYYL